MYVFFIHLLIYLFIYFLDRYSLVIYVRNIFVVSHGGDCGVRSHTLEDFSLFFMIYWQVIRAFFYLSIYIYIIRRPRMMPGGYGRNTQILPDFVVVSWQQWRCSFTYVWGSFQLFSSISISLFLCFDYSLTGKSCIYVCVFTYLSAYLFDRYFLVIFVIDIFVVISWRR